MTARELVVPLGRRQGGGKARHQLGDDGDAGIFGVRDEQFWMFGDDLVRQVFLPRNGGVIDQGIGGGFYQQPPDEKNPGKTSQKYQRVFETAIPFASFAQFTRLGAEMCLPEEKNIVQNPLVRRFNPPASAGIVKNQVAGGILVEDQAGQRQFQGAGRVFKLKVAKGEPEAAGKRLLFFTFQESESIVDDQQCAHRTPV